MHSIIEPSKSYSNIDELRNDLSTANVKETPCFNLGKMLLTTHGTIQVPAIGEFPLTDIALRDALRWGGLNPTSCDNFFREKSEILDHVVISTVNAFFKYSQKASSQVKLITRAMQNSDRLVLGIPSSGYALFTHEQAVEKIVTSLPPGLHLARCNVYPRFMELAFTDPVNTVQDAVGKTIELGANFFNSQGTRTRALVAAAFSLRLICTNGATAKHQAFSLTYPHRGNLLQGSNGEFGRKIEEIASRFSVMMAKLPSLGNIPASERFVAKIALELKDVLKVKDRKHFIDSIDLQNHTVSDVWNRITHMPQQVKDPEIKLKLEQLGFKILTMHLI